jgi:class 3 adenylate cyclase
VNLAARMLEKCQGDDLVLADETFHRAETQDFLRHIRQSAIADHEQFSGFHAPIRVWRIPMLAPRAG